VEDTALLSDGRTATEVLDDAREALELTKRALTDFLSSHGPARSSGLRNILIFGLIRTYGADPYTNPEHDPPRTPRGIL
jgi:hypothetical protein